jgi:TolB-like protein/class 3 adenylate cyclase
MERRLTTILAADVVGYSAQMEESEVATVGQLSALTQLVDTQVRQHGGRLFSRAGDGFLCEFASPVAAVQTGYGIQRQLQQLAADDSDKLQIRVGIHLADVIVDGDDLLGDGVNVAARVEALADSGKVLVTQPVFEQVKRKAQLSFEDLGLKSLKNISEEVRVFQVVGEVQNHSYITGEPGIVAKDKPSSPKPNSIAVIPFTNFSDDPDQEYFSNGFSEDLITELSRFPDISVISRNASFAYRGKDVDLREVGHELGVAYCIEGSVRKMGERVRITSQLISTQTGDHVWAEKYDCTLPDLFDVQDELVSSTVSMVSGKIENFGRQAAKAKRPADMEAYDCLLRGLEFHKVSGVTKADAEQAEKWFSLAIEKDPEFGRAYAWKACAVSYLSEWTGQDHWNEIVELGKRGLELDGGDAECHRIMGSIFLNDKDYAKAKYHFERALQLNPNHAYIVGRLGEVYNFLGDGKTALEYQRRAVAMDPLLPSYCRELEAVAHYVLDQPAEVIAVVDQLHRPTRRATAYAVAALTQLDDLEQLQKAVDQLMLLDPDFTVSGFVDSEYFKDDQIPNRLSEQLREAGLPMD